MPLFLVEPTPTLCPCISRVVFGQINNYQTEFVTLKDVLTGQGICFQTCFVELNTIPASIDHFCDNSHFVSPLEEEFNM